MRFSKRIELRVQNIRKNGNDIKRKAALAIDQALVVSTPVDTGRARTNWLASTGKPITGTLDSYVPGKHGSTKGEVTRRALSQAQQAIAAVRRGEAIFIANNLPYIGVLNRGSSAQAPANFVELAIRAGVRAVAGVKILEK